MLELPLIDIPIRVSLIPHSTALVAFPSSFVQSSIRVNHYSVPVSDLDSVDCLENALVNGFVKIFFHVEIFIVKDRTKGEHL